MFPKDYDFYIVNDGIDRKTTLLRAGRQRRRSSIAHQKIAGREQNFSTQAASGSKVALDKNQTTKMDIELPDSTPNNQQPSPSNDSLPLVANISSTPADVDGLTGAMSALKFVPLSIRFGGRNRGKAGFSKK